MIDPMFQPHHLFSTMITTAVRSANTLSFVALVVCLTSCGGDDKAATTKDQTKPQSQAAAGTAAQGGAGTKATTAGSGESAGASGSVGSGTAGRAAGSGGASAADGGKGGKAGSPAAGSTGGKAGTSSGGAGAGAGSSGNDSPDPDASVPDVNVSEISASLASAICDALKGCVGAAKLAMLTGREDCVARYSASLEQDEFGTLAESVKAGAIKLDESKLATCYDDTRAQGCNVVADRLPTSCQEAIAAQKNVGESCSLDADCAGDAFCPIDSACPRNCQANQAAGAACTRDAECQRGATCNAGKCSVPAATGEACAGSSGSVCALGESCVGSDNMTPGTCDTNANVQSGELNAACTPGGSLCKEGLSCAYNGVAFECVGAVGKGEACTLALPSQCPVDTYCSAADLGQSGTCLALPTEGKTCVLNNACAGGHVCVTQNSTATCRKLGDVGDACLADGLCRSGVCDNGTCAIRSRCE
jgi:hypothetical protein